MYKLKLTKEELVHLYEDGYTTSKLAQICGCQVCNIHVHLKKQGVTFRSFSEANRKYKYNREFFKEIDTEEKAYILGFLFADGYNQEGKNCVSIRIDNQDEEILFKIRKALNSNHPITRYGEKENSDFSITCQTLSKTLAEKGCVRAKSCILEYPLEHISDDLHSHFIRGYFDGDGCISISNYKNYIQYSFSMVGTWNFLSAVQNIFMEKCGVNKTKFSKRKIYGCSYTLHYNGRMNVLKLLDYLYRDSTIYLERKFLKYKSIPT